MSNVTLFAGASAILQDLKAGLPAYLADADARAALAKYNDEVPTGQAFPTLSIKGKVFTLNKDGEQKRLMRNEDEVLQSIQVTVVRANPNSRVYYEGEYVEGAEGDAARPDCYSNDGVAPASDARNKQCDKCSICPNAVWGTGNRGEGTACTVNTRLAIVAPELLPSGKAEPTLLRVPAGSRRNFSDFVSTTKRHGVPYFAAVVKIGFDPEAPAPKLTFKTVGYINDEAFAEVRKLADDREVLEMIGAAPRGGSTHSDAGDVAHAAVNKAKSTPAPTPAPAPAPTPAPAPVQEYEDDDGVTDVEVKAPAAPAPAPKPRAAAKKTAKTAPPPDDDGDLLGDLDSLLAQADD